MIKKTVSSGIILAAREEAKAKQKFRGTVTNGVDIFSKNVKMPYETKKDSMNCEEINNFSLLQPRAYYKTIHIHDEPICLDLTKSFDPNIRATKGYYSIQYVPKANGRVKSKRCRFLIGQDLVRMSIQCSGPYHFKKLCEEIPELDWIRRNTTWDNGLFRVAKAHPGIPFPFTIDYVRYNDIILKKAEEKGIDIDGKTFVTYIYNKDTYEKYKDIKLAPVPTKKDYIAELKRAELESAEAGETSED